MALFDRILGRKSASADHPLADQGYYPLYESQRPIDVDEDLLPRPSSRYSSGSPDYDQWDQRLSEIDGAVHHEEKRRTPWWQPSHWRGRRKRCWALRLFLAAFLAFALLVAWLAYTAPLSKSLEPIAPPQITLLANDGTPIARSGAMVAELDPATRSRIDTSNPMRGQRAWEVLRATGQGLADWQDTTAPALLPLSNVRAFVMDAPKDWLTPRIEARFDQMLRAGALEEARANLATWDPRAPSAKAIGAADLIALLQGDLTQAEARNRATIATRQFAKRQRTWFRARMSGWARISAPDL